MFSDSQIITCTEYLYIGETTNSPSIINFKILFNETYIKMYLEPTETLVKIHGFFLHRSYLLYKVFFITSHFFKEHFV